MKTKKLKVAILSDEDVLDEKHSSSIAIRQLYLASLLSKKYQVSIFSTFGKKPKTKKGKYEILNSIKSFKLIKSFDIVLIELSSSSDSIAYRYVKSGIRIPTIVDTHYAILFEKLVSMGRNKNNRLIFNQKIKVITSILKKGDHFVCATGKQRDYLMGAISMMGKINPTTFTDELVSIIPTLAKVKFRSGLKNLKGEMFSRDDKLIIWLGGIYPWFDPLPLIRSMPQVLNKVKSAKLLILGGKHPLAGFNEQYERSVEESKKLSLFDDVVKFIDWVGKEQSFKFCSEADLAIVLSKRSLEDEFAFRTRILIPLQLGVPTVTNGKDYISNLINKFLAGVVVSSDSPKVLSDQICKILKDRKFNEQISSNTALVVSQLKKDTFDEPLSQFLINSNKLTSFGSDGRYVLNRFKNWFSRFF